MQMQNQTNIARFSAEIQQYSWNGLQNIVIQSLDLGQQQ